MDALDISVLKEALVVFAITRTPFQGVSMSTTWKKAELAAAKSEDRRKEKMKKFQPPVEKPRDKHTPKREGDIVDVEKFKKKIKKLKYRVDVFCITVFKRTSKQEFSISPSALHFLARHGFDFKKLIVEGVTYCNQTELGKLRDKILSGDYDFDLFEHGLSERMRTLRGQIVCEMFNESDILPFEYSNDTNCQKRPIIIELFRNGDKDYAFKKYLWDRPLNSLEEVVMTFALSEEFPALEFHIDEERTLVSFFE
ncbi:unnamed protein product [Angiostrongylus costaricensis]|uniref:FTH domain-containing protein n=1 Tax=Angiostrongylus costaricensis TaxID=334426 RepID=A0A0R3PWR4_ANGCS|nr:unnamed protein product [Angiostrongylus costaricensis]